MTTEQTFAAELLFKNLQDYGVFLSDVELSDMDWSVQVVVKEQGRILANEIRREIKRGDNQKKELLGVV